MACRSKFLRNLEVLNIGSNITFGVAKDCGVTSKEVKIDGEFNGI